MKKLFSGILKILLFLWQFPQEVVGWVLLVVYLRKQRITKVQPFNSSVVFRVRGFRGGLSLSRYIFVSRLDYTLICHEYGHSRQSKILGWLYLPLIGLPSAIWYSVYRDSWKKSYYWFYPEKWADFLGGVKRVTK